MVIDGLIYRCNIGVMGLMKEIRRIWTWLNVKGSNGQGWMNLSEMCMIGWILINGYVLKTEQNFNYRVSLHLNILNFINSLWNSAITVWIRAGRARIVLRFKIIYSMKNPSTLIFILWIPSSMVEVTNILTIILRTWIISLSV